MKAAKLIDWLCNDDSDSLPIEEVESNLAEAGVDLNLARKRMNELLSRYGVPAKLAVVKEKIAPVRDSRPGEWQADPHGECRHEIQQLRQQLAEAGERVSELETKFGHIFGSPEESPDDPHRERCRKCGLNIRDGVHLRMSDLAQGAKELPLLAAGKEK